MQKKKKKRKTMEVNDMWFGHGWGRWGGWGFRRWGGWGGCGGGCGCGGWNWC